MKAKENEQRKNGIIKEAIKTREQKGITLIALIITIIIMLILAGVTINVAIGDNGLFSKSKEAVEIHKEEAAREKVSMAIGEYMLDINKREMTEEEKDNHLKEILSNVGKTSEASDDKYYEIEVDGHIFWVNKNSQEIISKGKTNGTDEKTEPEPEKEIESIALNQTTLTIAVGKTTEVGLQVTYTPSDAVNQGVTWSTSDETKAAVDSNGKVTGVAETGEGEAVTITATTANGKTATCSVIVNKSLPAVGETPPTGGWDIDTAKKLLQRDGLRTHIGEQVSYSPKAGGTWRIFYYNTEAEWGDPVGTLYLKRDYDTNLKIRLMQQQQTSPSTTTIQKMKDMNPMWDRNGNSSSIGEKEYNEQAVAWLCDKMQWEDYYKTSDGQTIANYAIGSPSVEMYMKAYNIWKAGTKNIDTSTEAEKTLMCKVDNENGYKLGAFGSYTYNTSKEYWTGSNTIEEGPEKIFMTSGSDYWWLSSPSGCAYWYVCYINGQTKMVDGQDRNADCGVFPIVSINP